MRFDSRWRFKPILGIDPNYTQKNRDKALAFYLHGASDVCRRICELIDPEDTETLSLIMTELQGFIHENQWSVDPERTKKVQKELFLDTVGAIEFQGPKVDSKQ